MEIALGAVLLANGIAQGAAFLYARQQLSQLKKMLPKSEQPAGSEAEAIDLTGLGLAMASVGSCEKRSLKEVRRASGKWAGANLLGSGAFGDVYKGVNPKDSAEVWAVKRAKLPSREFEKEVTAMAGLHHVNVLRVVGFCSVCDFKHTRLEQILVYPFMPNGGLDKWIGSGAPRPLSMRERMNVSMGVAAGLQYLHFFNMVHRDVKPANILLDANMQPKVADFGLVRCGEGTTVMSTRLMGTTGFIDPAYVRSYKAIPANDVYSFGVVLLLLITGRTAPMVEVEEGGKKKRVFIKEWVAGLVEQGKVEAFRDPTLDAPLDLLLSLAQLALSCTDLRTAARPTMTQVLAHLQILLDGFLAADPNRMARIIDEGLGEMDMTRHMMTLMLE